MISLKQEKYPYDLELPYGISVTVKPLTTPAMLSAQAAARRLDAPRTRGELVDRLRRGEF